MTGHEDPVAWLRAQIQLSYQQEAQARARIEAAEDELRTIQQQRAQLTEQLDALTTAAPLVASMPSMPPAPPPFAPPFAPPFTPAPPSDPRQAETSTRTVQNVLFVLGGLLLGTAAIAFTAVAWATFGEAGRAAVLAAVTVIMLAVPLVALWRGLGATAETFAAVGLLLVLLDGYALWYIDLAGVQTIPPARYVALVAGVASAIALAYRLFTRLIGPGFAAIALIQPVLVLLVEPESAGLRLQSLLGSATALVNVVIIVIINRAHGRSPRPPLAGMRVMTWLLTSVWLTFAFFDAILAELGAGGARVTDRVGAGAALVTAAVVLMVAAIVARAPSFRSAAAGTLVVSLAIALGYIGTTAQPEHRLLLVAAVSAGLSVLVAVGARLLPYDVRPGVRAGALVVATAVSLPIAGFAVIAAAAVVLHSYPFWAADLIASGPHPPLLTWQLPVAAVLISVAFAVVARPRVRIALVSFGGLLAILALPGTLPLPWWAPGPIALIAAPGALAAALAGRTIRATVGAATCGAVLALFAVLTSLARPGLTAAVLTGVAALGVGLAAVAARRPRGGADRLVVGGVGLSVALVSVPPAIGAALVASAVADWWAARGLVAGLVPVLIGLALVARLSHRTWPAMMAAFALAGVGIDAIGWPATAAFVGHESKAVYAGVSVLVVALAFAVMQRADDARPVGAAPASGSPDGAVPADEASGRAFDDTVPVRTPSPVGPARFDRDTLAAAITMAVPGLIGLAITLAPPVLGVIAGPYAWAGAIWSGRPSGVGLVPPDVSSLPAVSMTDAVALALLALASAVTHVALTGRPAAALGGLGIGGPTAILVAVTAAGAPWPTLPAASLLVGLALVLAAATVARDRARSAIATAQGLVYVGTGVAGSLSQRWTTLAALALVLVAAAVVAAVGRGPRWRTGGGLAAVGTLAALAATGGFAADLPAREVAFAVLGAAVVALFAGAAVVRGPDRAPQARAIHAAAQASGVVALLFTIGFPGNASAICVLWGVAIGLRALVPGTSATTRAALAATAGGYELLAWWLLLSSNGVTLIEAYTLPLAVVALLAGWAALRARPELRSWVAYGPALAAGFLPSLAAIIGVAGNPWRRLALGVAAIVVVILGSLTRRQAPVVIGGIVLVLVALHELVLVWQLLPGWIPLAIGGVVLVTLAITYERRLRDLGRLRAALGRMT